MIPVKKIMKSSIIWVALLVFMFSCNNNGDEPNTTEDSTRHNNLPTDSVMTVDSSGSRGDTSSYEHMPAKSQ